MSHVIHMPLLHPVCNTASDALSHEQLELQPQLSTFSVLARSSTTVGSATDDASLRKVMLMMLSAVSPDHQVTRHALTRSDAPVCVAPTVFPQHG
jgi:hypothetical protein